VFAAILIAGPVAYYLMGKWLQDFEDKISMSWWMFLLAAVLSVAIALITVSFQAIKAALINPVRSLKSE
jgi:putative ABC transport system permease protein